MRRCWIVCAALAVSFAGCSEGSSLTVTAEPAGENCPEGGFRIEADGEVFYSCDERREVNTVEVAAGADGNPCIGAALLVSVTLDDGTVRDAYACQPVEVDATSAAFLTGAIDMLIANATLQCACTPPEEQAGCASQTQLFEGVRAHVSRCVVDVLSIAGPAPEADRAVIECGLAQLDALKACYAEPDTLECSTESEEALDQCVAAATEGPGCGEPTDALGEWASSISSIGEFLSCPVSVMM